MTSSSGLLFSSSINRRGMMTVDPFRLIRDVACNTFLPMDMPSVIVILKTLFLNCISRRKSFDVEEGFGPYFFASIVEKTASLVDVFHLPLLCISNILPR